MDRNVPAFALAFLVPLLATISGCATIVTKKADLDEAPAGVRVFPPAVYLFVGKEESELLILPDTKRAYDIKPLTFLARQDFNIQIEDGQVKTLLSNQETTAILSLVKEAAQLAAQAAGVPMSKSSLKGTFGQDPGLYRLGDDGVFRSVQVEKPR